MSQAIAVANVFVDRYTNGERVNDLTPMKALKLVWYAHGWWRGLRAEAVGDRLIADESPEAWEWGPVFRSLYIAAKGYGNQPILRSLSASDGPWSESVGVPTLETAMPERDADQIRDFLGQIDREYGVYSGPTLSNMTHADGTPWSRVRAEHGGSLRNKPVIPDQYTTECFVELGQRLKAPSV